MGGGCWVWCVLDLLFLASLNNDLQFALECFAVRHRLGLSLNDDIGWCSVCSDVDAV